MVSSKELQNEYIKMYTQLRNYIWGFDTVEKLANLEIEVYNSFPDIAKIQSTFNMLYQDVRHIFSEDDELAEAVASFKELIESVDGDFYLKLDKVQEAI